MQKITPFLWFDTQAEEAANFYTSVFKNSRVTNVLRNGEGGAGKPGTVLTVNFELEGQQFIALSGGPEFKFTPAISFFVNCQTQAEVDDLWGKLLEGGEPDQCGWLRDKFGVSWQIIPSVLMDLLQDEDPAKSQRVMDAMLRMVKIDIAAIQAAAAKS
jgi:predicted 3-demethylubiquinone-9 3-methyltransferase (glyoxalase superfamily)